MKDFTLHIQQIIFYVFYKYLKTKQRWQLMKKAKKGKHNFIFEIQDPIFKNIILQYYTKSNVNLKLFKI